MDACVPLLSSVAAIIMRVAANTAQLFGSHGDSKQGGMAPSPCKKRAPDENLDSGDRGWPGWGARRWRTCCTGGPDGSANQAPGRRARAHVAHRQAGAS